MGVFTETILADTQVCTACMACELACGFRWSKKMDPSHSTIRVHRDDTTGLVDIQVLEGCDACSGVEIPYCISVCAPRVLSLGRRRGASAAKAR
jgi:Fe-S-cluster-containing dehydrogenase component